MLDFYAQREYKKIKFVEICLFSASLTFIRIGLPFIVFILETELIERNHRHLLKYFSSKNVGYSFTTNNPTMPHKTELKTKQRFPARLMHSGRHHLIKLWVKTLFVFPFTSKSTSIWKSLSQYIECSRKSSFARGQTSCMTTRAKVKLPCSSS